MALTVVKNKAVELTVLPFQLRLHTTPQRVVFQSRLGPIILRRRTSVIRLISCGSIYRCLRGLAVSGNLTFIRCGSRFVRGLVVSGNLALDIRRRTFFVVDSASCGSRCLRVLAMSGNLTLDIWRQTVVMVNSTTYS